MATRRPSHSAPREKLTVCIERVDDQRVSVKAYLYHRGELVATASPVRVRIDPELAQEKSLDELVDLQTEVAARVRMWAAQLVLPIHLATPLPG